MAAKVTVHPGFEGLNVIGFEKEEGIEFQSLEIKKIKELTTELVWDSLLCSLLGELFILFYQTI